MCCCCSVVDLNCVEKKNEFGAIVLGQNLTFVVFFITSFVFALI